MKSQNVVVAYVKHGETEEKVWKNVLSMASQQILPIIFVVLCQRQTSGVRATDVGS